MKKQLLIVSALACLFASKNVSAQEKVEKLDEVVVTATKFKTNKKNIGKVVYKITSETIKNAQGKTLLDLLNDVPGVEINGNYSNRGQNLGYYIRGGRNRQVAILIDGINVNDPSSFNGDFDLRQIDVNQIESIEILKGASSILYGTGAATGVINIILKKSSKNEFGGTFTTSVGSNRANQDTKFAADELLANFNFNGTVGKVDYLIGLNANNSKGLSAAENSNSKILFAEDAFERKNALLKVGYNVNDKLKIGVFGSLDKFTTDFDGFGATDANNNLKSNQKRVGLTTDYTYKNGALKVRTFLTDIDRDIVPSNDNYKGKVYGFDVFNNYKMNKDFLFLLGFASQFQDMFQKTSFSNIKEGEGKQHFYDAYASLNYNSSGLNFNLGGRLNMHNEYGNNFVFNINPSYNFSISKDKNLKIFASYSTAFITPTLSEIFTKLPTIKELKPEEDTTIEGGFVFDFSNKLSLNGTYFYREETNKIGYDFATFQTINDLGTFYANGFETEISYKPIDKLKLLANYSYVKRDESLLLKIPQNKFGIRADYKVLPSTFTSISYKYVGATKDFGDVDLASYSLLDLFINHKIINNKVTLFGSVTNLLNEDYQEIAGFTTRGRNYKLGLKIQF